MKINLSNIRIFESSNNSSGGTSIYCRMSSLMLGLDVTAVVTKCFIFKESYDGNAIILKKEMYIESRLKTLEGKKK